MNWIIIQGSDTRQKLSSFKKAKEDLTEKVTPFLKKIKTMKKNVKINFYANVEKNKTFE